MIIVGGIYNERSVFPEDDVIYGSGGRAAAALSLINPDITLTSFVGESRRRDIEYHVKDIWKACIRPRRRCHPSQQKRPQSCFSIDVHRGAEKVSRIDVKRAYDNQQNQRRNFCNSEQDLQIAAFANIPVMNRCEAENEDRCE